MWESRIHSNENDKTHRDTYPSFEIYKFHKISKRFCGLYQQMFQKTLPFHISLFTTSSAYTESHRKIPIRMFLIHFIMSWVNIEFSRTTVARAAEPQSKNFFSVAHWNLWLPRFAVCVRVPEYREYVYISRLQKYTRACLVAGFTDCSVTTQRSTLRPPSVITSDLC